MHFAYCLCTYNLRFRSCASAHALHVLLYLKRANFSRSCGSALRPLLLYLQFAISQPRLWQCSSRTTLVLKTCDLSAGAAGARFSHHFLYLQFACRSCGSALRVLARDRESKRANHETTSEHRFLNRIEGATARALKRVRRAPDKFARRRSESASTHRISTEGSPRARRIRTAPQRERFDTHNLCRGLAELKTKSHGATARALRRVQSPQRVRQAQFARRRSESASTRTISAVGSPRVRQTRTAPQRERFDTNDLRRGLAESKTNSHGATARALRRAQSPQRVRQAQGKFARRHSESASMAQSPQRVCREQDKLARRHSESASTRTISAEGSPSSRQIRTAPQRERFDTHTMSAEGSPSSRQIRTAPQRERFETHDLRKGFTFVSQRLQMSETLRLALNARTHFMKILCLPRAFVCDRVQHQRKTYCACHETRGSLTERWP